jgi:hypothetical protein
MLGFPDVVYYKLFDEDDGPVKSRFPVHPNDPFIRRVDVTLLPPPHQAQWLILEICWKEDREWGIDWDNDDAFGAVLYETISSRRPYEHDDYIPFLSDERPGSDPRKPVVLIVSYKGMLRYIYWM